MRLEHLINRFKQKLTFTNKIFLILLTFSFILMLGLHQVAWKITKDQLYSNLGDRALTLAKSISLMPSLNEAIKNRDLQKISDLLTPIVNKTDADFIVIGDTNQIRLFHTNTDKVNKKMVGDDSDIVLDVGEPIISMKKGSLGVSMRGKAPIIDKNNIIVGIVSVGYLETHMSKLHKELIFPMIGMSIILILILFILAWIFSRYIKKQIFNLEPKQIAILVHKQQTILESIFEGLIVIDLDYNITTINKSARKYLNLIQPEKTIIGQHISSIIKYNNFFDNDEKNYLQDRYYEIRYFNDKTVIASRIRIMMDNEIKGWVISFRDRNKTNYLGLQLSQIQKYADNLRVMHHEYQNRMSTLSGMLYMGNYDEAIEFIEALSLHSQIILDDITAKIKIPSICGLLLGKHSQAKEKGINLTLDTNSILTELPSHVDEAELMSIIGNLIDNAIEATLINNDSQLVKNILVYISNATNELVIEVSDYGSGIDEKIKNHIFEWGVTTKNDNLHGIGLYLVSNYVEKMHGYITINDNEPIGTIFSVFIPKKLK